MGQGRVCSAVGKILYLVGIDSISDSWEKIVQQVIAEERPEPGRVQNIAKGKELCKQSSKLISGLGESGNSKTLLPLAIIFEHAESSAGIPKRVMDNASDGSQVLERCRTYYFDQE